MNEQDGYEGIGWIGSYMIYRKVQDAQGRKIYIGRMYMMDRYNKMDRMLQDGQDVVVQDGIGWIGWYRMVQDGQDGIRWDGIGWNDSKQKRQ